MRYAIFSDIHGNLPAWNAVLNDMRSQDVDRFVCLGDIVGYGPKPQEVLDGIRSVTSNIVIGNHDAAAAGTFDDSIFNDKARKAIQWTRNQLNKKSLKFLRDLPLVIEDEDIFFVHAEMSEPGQFLYLNSAAEARLSFQSNTQKISFVGHNHNPGIFVENPDDSIQRLPDDDATLENDRRYIVDVGSVGEPRNPQDIRARYLIYDKNMHSVSFRKIEFDVEAYRTELQYSGLKTTPYFLQIVDQYYEAAAKAPEHAMTSEAEAPLEMAIPGKQVVLLSPGHQPSPPQPSMVMPLPKERSSAGAITLVITCLAAMIGALLWLNREKPRPEEEMIIVADTTLPDPETERRPKARVQEVRPPDPIPPTKEPEPKVAEVTTTEPDTREEPDPTPPTPEPVVEIRTSSPNDKLLFDFEGDNFDSWEIEGTAFGSKPAGVQITARKGFSGHEGSRIAHSSHGGDGPTGKMTSEAFKITHPYLRLLVAGGPHEGKTYVGLEIDGKLVHSSTGGERLEFQEVLWDLSSFADQEAKLVAVDAFNGRWGVITFDHVVLTDEKGTLIAHPPSQ